MLKRAARALIGTRWEAPAKRLYSSLTGDKNTRYDWQTIEIMRRVLRSDSNAIDAGAFEGGMLRHICRFAPRGRHLAVEPNPEKAAHLERAFGSGRFGSGKSSSVRVLEVALGDMPGELTFHRARNHPALSGLHPRPEYLGAEPTEEIRVRMETLDRVVPEDLPIAFMKMDVEGAELGVLRGGIATLRRSRPVIVFESGKGGADYFGTRPEMLHDLLSKEIGLRVSLLDAWLEGEPALSREGFTEQFDKGFNFYFVAHP